MLYALWSGVEKKRNRVEEWLNRDEHSEIQMDNEAFPILSVTLSLEIILCELYAGSCAGQHDDTCSLSKIFLVESNQNIIPWEVWILFI
jgi:hypothetical protein